MSEEKDNVIELEGSLDDVRKQFKKIESDLPIPYYYFGTFISIT